jgi:hypothetical protein
MQQLNRKQDTSEMQYIGCQFYHLTPMCVDTLL